VSFWDALIVTSAEQARAVHLISEDLNDGQSIGAVRVVNPFVAR
jgi:predicted nucleic acid-binding protein